MDPVLDLALVTAKSPSPVVAFLTGPTAVGKSAVALVLVQRLGLELLSIDSRQIYRRLEIGTAKPTPVERAHVPHHLLDLLDPEESASAGWFRERYLEATAEIQSRGARALAAGGTGLYWEACTRGLHRLPASRPDVRAELEGILERDGLGAVFAQLAELDPKGAAGLDRHNRHRVLRALELVRVTGQTLDEIYAGAREGESGPRHPGHAPEKGMTPSGPARETGITDGGDASAAPGKQNPSGPPVVVLSRPRAEIHARIQSRCDAMLAAGLLDEIRGLLGSGIAPDAPGLRTVGYREFLPHLLSGASLADCVDRFVGSTRQYAKRQETWFRNRIGEKSTIEIASGESAESVADRVVATVAG